MNSFIRLFLLAALAVTAGLPAGLSAQANPDLTLTGTPAGPVSAIRGQEDVVTVTIRNGGSAATAATFDVTVYLSEDETPSVVEKVGDLGVSAAIGVGVERQIQIPVRIPALRALGDYVWLVQVDAADVVAESDEGNNVGVGNAVSILPTPPDLTVSSAPSGPLLAPLGTTLSVVTSIENIGQGATSDPFDVSVYLSVDKTLDPGDTRVGRVTLPDVVLPGETRSVSVLATIPPDFAEGAHYWLAVVDADGAQTETDDNNNSRSGTPVTTALILPDLSLVAPPTGVNAVFRGVTTGVEVQITNSGDGATAQAFDVVVYISKDPIVGNDDDVRVGDVAVTTELDVGDSRTVTVPARVSAVQPTGVYHWIAVVDDGGFVAEGDEENNVTIGTAFSVLAQPSDLMVSTAPTGPSLVIRNSFHDVRLSIENRGAGTTTGAFQVTVYLSGDEVAGNADDVRIGNVTVSAPLAENEVRDVDVPVTIPSDQEAGTFRYLAVVDATGVEVEFDEENNARFATQDVVVSVNAPDLAVATDPFGPTKILREGGYTVAAEVQNQSGGLLVDDFAVAAVLSVDGEIGNGDDVFVGDVQVTGGLLSGEIVSVEIPVSIPAGLTLGDFRWGVTADPEDGVDEVNEANNSRVGSSVTLLPFPPDLVFGADLAGPEEVSRGRLYSIPVNILNAGQGATIAGFDVNVYLSLNGAAGDSDDILVGTALVDEEIAPSGSRIVNVPVIIPADQTPSQFQWAAIINPEGRVVESDRSNNTILGNGVAFPVLDLPTSMSFGSVTLGQSKTQVLEITNTGTAALSFDVDSLSPTVSTNPRTVSDLAPGETQVVAITVTPGETGDFDGDVRITSDLRGEQVIRVDGQSVSANRDRVRVDLDRSAGVQDDLVRRMGVNETVDMELHVEGLPQVSSVAIRVAYDPEAVALTTNGLVAGAFVSEDALAQTTLVSPGLMEVGMVSQSGDLGEGSGHLGTLTFRTIGGFYDASGERSATVEAVSIRYYDTGEAVEETLDVSASVRLNLDLVCWSDFDGSGEVGFPDFLQIVNAFNASPSSPEWTRAADGGVPLRRLDANGDNVVDFTDFGVLQEAFGGRCQ